jgi:hypothetical protein
VPLEVEVGVLHPEAEEALLGRGGVGQVDAVVWLLHLDLEAEALPGHGREGERVAHLIPAANEATRDHQRLPPPLDAVYRLVAVDLLHLVLDREVPARLVHRLLAPGGGDEALTGDRLPQDAVGIRTVRDAQDIVGRISAVPGSQGDGELTHRVPRGDALRHPRDGPRDGAGLVPDDEGRREGSGGQDEEHRRPRGPAGVAEPPRKAHPKTRR